MTPPAAADAQTFIAGMPSPRCSVCGEDAIRYVEGPTGRRRHYCGGHGPTSAEAWTRIRYLAPPGPALVVAPPPPPVQRAAVRVTPDLAARAATVPSMERRLREADRALREALALVDDLERQLQAFRNDAADQADLAARLREAQRTLADRDRTIATLRAEGARLQRELAAAESVAMEALDELPAHVSPAQEGAPSPETTASGPETAPPVSEDGPGDSRAEIASSTAEPAAALPAVPPLPAGGFPKPLGRRATKRPVRAVPKGAVTVTPAPKPVPVPAPEPEPAPAAAPEPAALPPAAAAQLGILTPTTDPHAHVEADSVAELRTMIPLERLIEVMVRTRRPRLLPLEATRNAEKATRALSDQDRRATLRTVQTLIEGGWRAVQAEPLEAMPKPTRAVKVSRALRVILGDVQDGGPWLILDVARRGSKRWYRRER